MDQSHFVFFALLFAFLVFITVRGELPAYIQVLL